MIKQKFQSLTWSFLYSVLLVMCLIHSTSAINCLIRLVFEMTCDVWNAMLNFND